MTEPDHVYDDYPINERFWDWLVEIGEIEPGDEVRVVTETTEWQARMEVLEVRGHDRIDFESTAGTRYMLITYSSNHPLEPSKPMVRTADGFESKGVLARLEVYRA